MRAGLVETPPAPVSVPSSRLRVETAIDKYLVSLRTTAHRGHI
jgi:hypothetical protein